MPPAKSASAAVQSAMNTVGPEAVWSSGTQWFQLAGEAWWMWAEAASVIAMRSALIAFERPGHGREAQRMVTEKLAAAFSLSQRLARVPPVSPEQAMRLMLTVYSPRVAANRRRLARRFRRS